MNEISIFIFQLAVLIFSVMIHEVAHGYVADKLGDLTARLAGRLTLNPLKHLDPFGSVILPLLLAIPALFGQPAFIFGWAKPVPYNPFNLSDPEKGAAKIAAAGPLSNLFLAAIFGIIIRIVAAADFGGGVLIGLLSTIVSINLLLAFFNLIPVPPIDGSKVLSYFLPHLARVKWNNFWRQVGYRIAQNKFLFLIILFFSFRYIFGAIFFIIAPPINFFHTLFAGFPSPFF
ncbi:MAG: site-2 protease family protein [bacterium]|nr:site-2 protease family protein [bacterium]